MVQNSCPKIRRVFAYMNIMDPRLKSSPRQPQNTHHKEILTIFFLISEQHQTYR
jgi:hypothetical protein